VRTTVLTKMGDDNFAPIDTPAMPSMKISQLIPIGVLLLQSKLDFDHPDYLWVIRIAFIVVQVANLLLVFYSMAKINAMPETDEKIVIPEKTSMGKVVEEAKVVTAKEHDYAAAKQKLNETLMQTCIIGGIHYKWEKILPLLLKVAADPFHIYESELFQIYVLGKKVEGKLSRPWKKENPMEAMMGGLGGGGAEEPTKKEKKAIKKKDDKKKD